MRIAVLADTHDHCPANLPGRLRTADEIWHLGDVCEPGILVGFERLGRPLRVVQGNCDSDPIWPRELRIELGGVRFFLVHIPPAKAPLEVDVVLHGHTHVPCDDTDASGVRWLNPGSIAQPRGGRPASFAWLTIDSGRIEWRVMEI
jgi:hypothetical protein